MAQPIPGRPIAPDLYPFPDDPERWLPWPRVEQRLRSARNYWLATAGPSGVPHATPVWGVWLDATLYFDGPPTTRWARNLAANPRLTMHLESGEDVVIVEGHADDLVTDDELAGRIVTAWNEKYGRLAPQPSTIGLFRMRPRSARAWSQSSLVDGTRWTFLQDRPQDR
jgi:nitroimidazol reductase NimA-like FMN-containing flavoprotein (pyridoxamine 5'-phosphate oxidase superfamily)